MKRLFQNLLLLCLAAFMNAAHAQEAVRVFAAGSLREALDEVAKVYTAASGVAVQSEYGPSGSLRDRIARGEAADVFASANMAHPQSLRKEGRASEVRPFATNRLCALAHPHLDVDSRNLLDAMLKDEVKVGMSTPKADPSGDYAIELFMKADAVHPGARAKLETKALRLTGGANAPSLAPGRSVYGMLVDSGQADIFLTYCTNVVAAQKEYPQLKRIEIPPEVSVHATYGVALLGKGPQARAYFDFLLGAQATGILQALGFGSP